MSFFIPNFGHKIYTHTCVCAHIPYPNIPTYFTKTLKKLFSCFTNWAMTFYAQIVHNNHPSFLSFQFYSFLLLFFFLPYIFQYRSNIRCCHPFVLINRCSLQQKLLSFSVPKCTFHFCTALHSLLMTITIMIPHTNIQCDLSYGNAYNAECSYYITTS